MIPGIFVALILRMDVARAAAPPPAVPPRARYFGAVMAGYVAGLSTTIAVMNIFNAAQPAGGAEGPDDDEDLEALCFSACCVIDAPPLAVDGIDAIAANCTN